MDALANLGSQHMVDCTLACDGGQIEVHKMVLSVCSTYLQKVIQTHPVQHPIIILPSIKINDLRILVNYMYTGELLNDADLPSPGLVEAAKFLGINSIKDFLSKQSQLSQSPSPQPQQQQQQQQSQQQQQHHLLHNNNNHHNHHHRADTPDDMADDTGGYLGADLSTGDLADDMADDLDDDDDDDLGDDGVGIGDDTTGAFTGVDTGASGDAGTDSVGDPNRIRCHLCDIRLSDVKCLYRHVLTRHLPDRWGYRCEFCDREFSRDDHLMRHYTTKHKGMDFDRDKIRETRRHNREMAKTFHDQFSLA